MMEWVFIGVLCGLVVRTMLNLWHIERAIHDLDRRTEELERRVNTSAW